MVAGVANRGGAVTGSAAASADSGVASSTLTTLRLTALAIIVVILLLVYRRPLLWLLPLFGALGAIVVAEAGARSLAGIVLGATFADLARLPNAPVAEVGIAVAVGVLLDTLLVRTVLVPAALLTIGERVWWPARPASSTSSGG